jgi:hypothetical protein
MGWAIFSAIFSQTHLIALLSCKKEGRRKRREDKFGRPRFPKDKVSLFALVKL